MYEESEQCMINHRDTETRRFFNFLNKLFYKLCVSVPLWLFFLIISLPGVALADDSPVVLVKVNGTPITLTDVEEEIDRIIPRTLFHRNVSPERVNGTGDKGGKKRSKE
ncbi:MAG: hypothetical protein HZC11_01825 [Nitrospirae bacterium]|nr:hypothetical protein [Nitrospirota bacterium]